MSKRPRPSYLCECGDHAFVVTTKAYVTIVSPENKYLLDSWPWFAQVAEKQVYAARKPSKRGKQQSLHRVILGLFGDDLCDHRNGNGLDNRTSNLRQASRGGNRANARKWKKNTSSRFKGVSYDRKSRTWKARFGSRPYIYLGYFTSEVDAALAYDVQANLTYGEFAKLNFPKGVGDERKA